MHVYLTTSGDLRSIAFAVFTYNRTTTSMLNGESPYEKFYSESSNLRDLRIFGSLVYLNLRPFNRTKFSNRSSGHVFVGYPDGVCGYMCWNPVSKKILISRDVIFVEGNFMLNKSFLTNDSGNRKISDQSNSAIGIIKSQIDHMPVQIGTISDTNQKEPGANSTEPISSRSSAASTEPISTPVSTDSGLASHDSSIMPIAQNVSSIPVATSTGHTMHTRSKSGVFHLNPKYALSVKVLSAVPKNVFQAKMDPAWARTKFELWKSMRLGNWFQEHPIKTF